MSSVASAQQIYGCAAKQGLKMGQQGPRMGEFNFGAQRETGHMLRSSR